jgi:hypothetical protein
MVASRAPGRTGQRFDIVATMNNEKMKALVQEIEAARTGIVAITSADQTSVRSERAARADAHLRRALDLLREEASDEGCAHERTEKQRGDRGEDFGRLCLDCGYLDD